MNFSIIYKVSYLNYLKHFINKKAAPIVRDTTYFLHSHSQNYISLSLCYIVYKWILKLMPITPFDILNHRLYSEIQSTSSIYKLLINRDGITSNLIYNLDPEDFSLISVPLPDICVFKHENVRIHGNSDFIIDVRNNYAINDFSYNMDPRYENIDGILISQKENLALLRYDGILCNKKLKSGIILSGKFCHNYYHQMYEIMIKLLVIEDAFIPDEIPLVVDQVTFSVKSFRQLFDSLNITGRKIEIIEAKEIIEFENLYYISAVNIIPPNRVHLSDDISYDIIFDISLLRLLRERLLAVKSNNHFPKKIFISRKSSSNRKYNEDEVVLLVKKYGYTVVAPEEYNLFDQISLFNEAESIVGASGAAFSNILFCKKNCQIICFQPRRLNISAFTTIAYSLGVNMRYCLGYPDGVAINTSYQVDLEMLDKMLNLLYPNEMC